MKKRRNERVRLMNPQPLEFVIGPEDTMKIMEKGTEVSCKLVEVLINSGKGIIGMSAAVFGLAKATVLVKKLIERKGFDMTSIYDDVKEFFEVYAETEEFEDCLERHGL